MTDCLYTGPHLDGQCASGGANHADHVIMAMLRDVQSVDTHEVVAERGGLEVV